MFILEILERRDEMWNGVFKGLNNGFKRGVL